VDPFNPIKSPRSQPQFILYPCHRLANLMMQFHPWKEVLLPQSPRAQVASLLQRRAPLLPARAVFYRHCHCRDPPHGIASARRPGGSSSGRGDRLLRLTMAFPTQAGRLLRVRTLKGDPRPVFSQKTFYAPAFASKSSAVCLLFLPQCVFCFFLSVRTRVIDWLDRCFDLQCKIATDSLPAHASGSRDRPVIYHSSRRRVPRFLYFLLTMTQSFDFCSRPFQGFVGRRPS
jgi:hypothetical protein